ncbi:MAG TPA: serine hydrolase domain-containing protein [Anaerolineaceae bacterium]|nr:serine hydrolase domain-containing protein [Anaerolineaceae bacterium]
MSNLSFDNLEAAIEEQLRQNLFSGVIHIAHNEKILFSHAYGLANRSDRLPNRLNTRFGIASGGKIFTATAILQLIAEGRLSLDQYLREIIPDLPSNLDPGVTIEQLLTHTSGIPDYFDEETESDYEVCWKTTPVYRMLSAYDFLPLIKDKKMKFTPGERFAYSNLGFVLLGLIVEKISGMRFQNYIEEKIFGPAWMRSSGYFSNDRLPEHCATGYIIDADKNWRSHLFSIPIVGHGDGGTYTTAADIGRFWKALLSKTYFDEGLLTQMTAPQVRASPNSSSNYGYGVWIDEIVGENCLSIVGEDPGVEFSSEFYPSSKLQITLLANENGALWQMSKIIRSEIFGLDQD